MSLVVASRGNAIRKKLAHQVRVGLAAGAHHADHGAARHHRRGRPSVRHPPLSIRSAATAFLRPPPPLLSSSPRGPAAACPLLLPPFWPSAPLDFDPSGQAPTRCESHTRAAPRATRRLPVCVVCAGCAAIGWLFRDVRGRLSVGMVRCAGPKDLRPQSIS